MSISIKGKKLKLMAIVLLMMLIIMTMISSIGVFAAGTTSAEQAQISLTTKVHSTLQGNKYSVEGGGFLSGDDLLVGSATDGYDLDESQFNRLTSDAQTSLVNDIAKASNEAVETESSKGVSESTVQDWWKQLQSKKGAGSKFLNVILENTKPDFVTANQIYKPFSGLVSTIMGIVAVIGMGLLGIVLVTDIFYIVLPPFRLLVPDSDSADSKKRRSLLVSNDAIYAVKCAEESTDSGGSKKQALGIYLKRRVVMLIILGICLMYLVSGSIFTLVGYILDLVSGFLGF